VQNHAPESLRFRFVLFDDKTKGVFGQLLS